MALLCQPIAERGRTDEADSRVVGPLRYFHHSNIYAHLDSQSKNLSARTMANTLTLPKAPSVKEW